MSVIIRPYRPGEEEYIAQAHLRVYRDEYHWGAPFSDYAMKIPRDFAAAPHGEDEQMWVAEVDGRLAGSIMLCHAEEKGVGQLRLFLLEKDVRGRGVGSALIETLMELVRTGGYRKLCLSTASPLTQAIGIYERLGFRETKRTLNTDWSLIGETLYELEMEMTL